MLCSIRNPELKLTSFIPSANILYTRHWFINVEVWPAAVAAKQMVNSRNEFYLSEMAIYMQLYTYITTRRYVYVFIYTCNTQSHATLLIALTRTHTYIHKKYAVCAVASSFASFCSKFHLCCCTLLCWDFFTSSCCCGVLKGGVQRATRTDEMLVKACCTAASHSNRRNVHASRQRDSEKQAVIGATALIAKGIKKQQENRK